MSQEYASNHIAITSEEFIGKQVPQELKAFRDIMEKKSVPSHYVAEAIKWENGWVNLADSVYDGEGIDLSPESVHEMQDVWENLVAAFKKKTGLTPYFCYVDTDNLTCGAEIESGEYWELTGIWELTPAAKKFREEWEEVYFVVVEV